MVIGRLFLYITVRGKQICQSSEGRSLSDEVCTGWRGEVLDTLGFWRKAWRDFCCLIWLGSQFALWGHWPCYCSNFEGWEGQGGFNEQKRLLMWGNIVQAQSRHSSRSPQQHMWARWKTWWIKVIEANDLLFNPRHDSVVLVNDLRFFRVVYSSV